MGDVGALGACATDAPVEFLPVKDLRGAIPFDDNNRIVTEPLIGCKTGLAIKAFTAAANGVELIRRTRIYDL